VILTYLVPVLFTFYIQGVLRFKKTIPAPKVSNLVGCHAVSTCGCFDMSNEVATVVTIIHGNQVLALS
jgi:hypothetical protein